MGNVGLGNARVVLLTLLVLCRNLYFCILMIGNDISVDIGDESVVDGFRIILLLLQVQIVFYGLTLRFPLALCACILKIYNRSNTCFY